MEIRFTRFSPTPKIDLESNVMIAEIIQAAGQVDPGTQFFLFLLAVVVVCGISSIFNSLTKIFQKPPIKISGVQSISVEGGSIKVAKKGATSDQ